MESPEQQDVETHDQPDEDAGPAVEPSVGEQGNDVEQDAQQSGVNPDQVAPPTSPPAPEQQSGVPNLPDGANEGVEAPDEESGESPEQESAEGEGQQA